jgi:hypothetical protein
MGIASMPQGRGLLIFGVQIGIGNIQGWAFKQLATSASLVP